MLTKRKSGLTQELKAVLARKPALTVKELADHLGVNRQFMAGFLAALEERGDISCRKVGPARIYFNAGDEERAKQSEKRRTKEA